MAKRITNVRAYEPEQIKLNQLSWELSKIQNSKVSIPEVLRRTISIPSLKTVLMKDAEAKRRLK